MKTLTPPTETKTIFINGLAKKEKKDVQARSDNEEIYEDDFEKDEARIDNSRKSSKPIKTEFHSLNHWQKDTNKKEKVQHKKKRYQKSWKKLLLGMTQVAKRKK